MLDTVRRWAPLTYAAFMDYRVGGVNLSARGLEVVRRRLRGESVSRRDVGMSPAEWRELNDLLAADDASDSSQLPLLPYGSPEPTPKQLSKQ